MNKRKIRKFVRNPRVFIVDSHVYRGINSAINWLILFTSSKYITMKNALSSKHFISKSIQLISTALESSEYKVAQSLIDWCLWYKNNEWALIRSKITILLNLGEYSKAVELLYSCDKNEVDNFNESEFNRLHRRIKKDKGDMNGILSLSDKTNSIDLLFDALDTSKQAMLHDINRKVYFKIIKLLENKPLPEKYIKSMLGAALKHDKANYIVKLKILNQILGSAKDLNSIKYKLFSNRYIHFDGAFDEIKVCPSLSELCFPIHDYVDELVDYKEIINAATFNSLSSNKIALSFNKDEWNLINLRRNDKAVELYVPDELFSKKIKNEHQTRVDVRSFFKLIVDTIKSNGLNVIPLHQYSFGISRQYETGNLKVSYHTISSGGNSLNFKESYLKGYFHLDENGYSGWAGDITTKHQHNKASVSKFKQERSDYLVSGESKYKQPNGGCELPNDYYFIALQLPHDSVAQHAYIDGITLTKTIAEILKHKTTRVVVKRHPLCTSSYVEEQLRELEESDAILLADGNINQLIKNSKAVFTVNSGVGFEALLHRKPVVVSGKSDYSDTCIVARNEDDLNAVINIGVDKIFDWPKVDAFMANYFSEALFKITDERKVSKKIVELLNKTNPIWRAAECVSKKDVYEKLVCQLSSNLQIHSCIDATINKYFNIKVDKSSIFLSERNHLKKLCEEKKYQEVISIIDGHNEVIDFIEIYTKSLYETNELEKVLEVYNNNYFDIVDAGDSVDNSIYYMSLLNLGCFDKAIGDIKSKKYYLRDSVASKLLIDAFNGKKEYGKISFLLEPLSNENISNVFDKIHNYIKSGDFEAVNKLSSSVCFHVDGNIKRCIVEHPFFIQTRDVLHSHSKKTFILTDVPFWRKNTGSCQRIEEIYHVVDRYSSTIPIILFVGRLGVLDFSILNKYEYNIIPLQLINNFCGNFNPEKQGFIAHVNRFLEPTEIDFYTSAISCALQLGRSHNLITEYVWLSDLALNLSCSTTHFIDLHDLQFERAMSFSNSGLESKYTISKDVELEIISRFDFNIAISKKEFDILNNMDKLQGKNLYFPHLPEARDHSRVFHNNEKLKLLFIGGHQEPNVQAIEWFVDKVIPKIKNIPYELHVYGRVCERLKIESELQNIVFLKGFVDDINSVYDVDYISLAPIMSGSGLKIKSVEALSQALPLVATQEGASGLDDENNKNFILCKSDLDFANAIMDLSFNKDKLDLLSINALRYFKRYKLNNDRFKFISLLNGAVGQ